MDQIGGPETSAAKKIDGLNTLITKHNEKRLDSMHKYSDEDINMMNEILDDNRVLLDYERQLGYMTNAESYRSTGVGKDDVDLLYKKMAAEKKKVMKTAKIRLPHIKQAGRMIDVLLHEDRKILMWRMNHE